MAKTKKTILKEYVEYRSLKNKTKNGLADIENHIGLFINHSKKPLSKFTQDMLIKYVNKINKEYKVNTSNTIKSSFIKNFIKWYYPDWSSRFRQLDNICSTEKPAPTYKAEDMLSEEEVKKLIQKEERVFWKAYFLTLFYGGCRPVEVVNLKWSDLEFEEDGAYFTIYSKKNKEDFLKFVPSDVSHYIQQLPKTSEYVFSNKRTKKPISVKGAYWKLRQLSKEVLGRKINLYLLRHSIATINYNKEGIKDDIIARQMGHTKSMKSTYVHNDKKTLKENAKKIYFKPEELAPEKKHKLELMLEQQQKLIESLEAENKDIYERNEDIEKNVRELMKRVKKMIKNPKK